ncbi:MAG: hypothetical protein K2W94_02790, partial [Alphaproteobacteria bacterium]|nr:hypothetical protein [Alphaproteobacteria bacterium]
HTYYGTQGIKNFLNDLVKGKNRYEVCNPKILYWPVDNTGQAYSDYARLFPKSEKLVTHTKIIYAKFEDKYLFGVHWQRDIKNNNQPISRFQLDECERLSESELKDRLYQISPVKAQEFLN